MSFNAYLDRIADAHESSNLWNGEADVDHTFSVNGVWYRMRGQLNSMSLVGMDMADLTFERLGVFGLWMSAQDEFDDGGPACDAAWVIAETVWQDAYDECDHEENDYE